METDVVEVQFRTIAHRKAYGEVLGFLELKLYPNRYTFEFKGIDDQPAEHFSDSGQRRCR
ncbi:MAG: hypothetical protein M3214_04915 [Actinomycetota bacterium]|nr:hypothetical protein [Actinomycetota bacterium]